MAVRRWEILTSTVTSSIWECPDESHKIRLLAPADLPSTTIWVGDVAKVSITAGLLDNILVTGACKLITTDFPTNTCNACPSDCAAAGMVGSSNTTPRAAIESLSCPSAKFLIFELENPRL